MIVVKVVNESVMEMIRVEIVKDFEENRDSLINQISQMCDGLSSRALRRLPLLALGMIGADENLLVNVHGR